MYNFYITPEEYEFAEKNGIPKRNVENRVRNLGWRKKRAITEPVKKYRVLAPYLNIAEKNGIKRTTAIRRMERGWDIERAITEPTYTVEEKLRKAWANQPKRKKKKKSKPKENYFKKLNQQDFKRMKRRA